MRIFSFSSSRPKRKSVYLIAVLGILATVILLDRISRLPSREGEPPNISGVYVFKKENCLKKSCFKSNPNFTLDYILEGDMVTVKQDTGGITMTHVGRNSKYVKWKGELAETRLLFDNSELSWDTKSIWHKRAEWGVFGILIGISRYSQSVTFHLDEENSLIVRSETGEFGLVLFLLPFIESAHATMRLVRVDAP